MVLKPVQMPFIKLNGKTQMRNMAAVLMTFVVAALCPARTITVDDDGAAAFNTIQAAIDDANEGDTVEIQPGRYTGPGNRDIDFKGKAMVVRSTDPNDRNIVDATVIDCNGTDVDLHRGFYFHRGEGAHSVLEGITITNGYAHGRGGAINCSNASSPTIRHCTITGNVAERFGVMYSAGGGIYCGEQSDPIIDSCTIRDNMAVGRGLSDAHGGGIFCEDNNPMIRNCTVIGNSATCWGGGILSGEYSRPIITHCIISGNAASAGGGVCCRGDHPDTGATINNTIVSTNSAEDGGGIASYGDWRTTLSNCTIIGNMASNNGGGITCISTMNLVVRNCTLSGNKAGNYGGGIYGSGEGETHIVNSILWGDLGEHGNEIALSACWAIVVHGATVTCSNIQGGRAAAHLEPGCDHQLVWDVGNIDADPCFASPGCWDPNCTPLDANDDFWVDGDHHLKSHAGRWEPTAQGWVFDNVTSACIDAGDISGPVGRERFPNGGIINMGAYGGTIEASKSYFGKPTCPFHMPADINDDCRVDALDLRIMLAQWLKRCQTSPSGRIMMLSGDLDADCTVGRIDFAILANSWRERYRP